MEPEQAAAAALRLSPLCVVALRSDGVQIQQVVEAEPLYLDLPHLELLSRLDAQPVTDVDPVVRSVAEQTGTTFPKLKAFATTLLYGSWLAPVPRAEHRPVPDHPAIDECQPFDLDAPGKVSLALPLTLRLRGGGFELIDADGRRRATLSAVDVRALGAFIGPRRPRKVLQELSRIAGAESFTAERLALVLGALDAAHLLRRPAPSNRAEDAPADRDQIIREVFDRHAAEQDAAEERHRQATGRARTKVIPVAFDIGAPLALGMIVAYAKAHDGGALQEVYDFRTDWVWSDDRLDQFTAEPAIYLFSNYLWSHERCLEVSRAVKERSPSSITIHGGPDTPKYEADCEAYFREHPHVDVTVRGEGEITCAETLAALATVIGDPQPDLSVLAGVEGISFRGADGVVRNPDRDRLKDLDILPSPFLTGLYDVFREVPDLFATLESSRGCPYGCTFCDWGSATTSRVRHFDLDRVFAEIDWCSLNRVRSTSLADANFGMFKRDIEIARHVAESKTTNGFPLTFGVSYAKNTVKHLQPIIRILVDGGIVTQGVLSLQSMDTETLDTIHRHNIRTERYDALADEMRQAQLPLMVELMMGLPGQTVETFADDLQQCIDREVAARVNHTTLLVNSPMNDPEYLAENKIEVSGRPGRGRMSLVVATASFTRQDRFVMEQLRLWFTLFENWGVLRLVARFVRQQTGLREMDLYRRLAALTEAHPERWPTLSVLVSLGTSIMAEPYSWALVMDEMHDLLVDELQVPDDAALASVLRAQRAVVPAHGRTLPEVVTLEHDVVAWQHAIAAAKGQGHRTDWPDVVRPLAEHGPGELTVRDSQGVLEHGMGMNRELNAAGITWELDSPLSRAGIAASQIAEWAPDRLLPLRIGKAAADESAPPREPQLAGH